MELLPFEQHDPIELSVVMDGDALEHWRCGWCYQGTEF